MLEVRSVSRRYGDVLAVDDVTFDVGSGEIVGLLGHNGAGKTTIMKMLTGFLEPDSGSIRLNGVEVSGKATQLQQTLGYLPENLPVYPELTVVEFLDYAADLKGLSGDTKRGAMGRALQATELESKILAPIATLSRGFRQRVGVAQAILGEPSLLILDEPANGLDPAQTEQMRVLIRRLAEHATVLLSTHVMQEVEAVCDRALIIRAGRLAVDTRLAELTRNRQLSLTTDARAEAVSPCLNGLASIVGVSPGSDDAGNTLHELTIELAGDDDPAVTTARITQQLVHSGVAVMGIQPVREDLQSLFMKVNDTAFTPVPEHRRTSAGGIDHAA